MAQRRPVRTNFDGTGRVSGRRSTMSTTNESRRELDPAGARRESEHRRDSDYAYRADARRGTMASSVAGDGSEPGRIPSGAAARTGSTPSRTASFNEMDTQGSPSVWYICCHPRVLPRLLLQSFAGSYWLSVKRSVQFFPMRFRDLAEEKNYMKEMNKKYRIKLMITGSMHTFACVTLWICVFLSFKKKWINLNLLVIEDVGSVVGQSGVKHQAPLVEDAVLLAPKPLVPFQPHVSWIGSWNSPFEGPTISPELQSVSPLNSHPYEGPQSPAPRYASEKPSLLEWIVKQPQSALKYTPGSGTDISELILMYFHVFSGLSLFFSLSSTFTPFIPILKNDCELSYYVFMSLNSLAFIAWSTWAIRYAGSALDHNIHQITRRLYPSTDDQPTSQPLSQATVSTTLPDPRNFQIHDISSDVTHDWPSTDLLARVGSPKALGLEGAPSDRSRRKDAEEEEWWLKWLPPPGPSRWLAPPRGLVSETSDLLDDTMRMQAFLDLLMVSELIMVGIVMSTLVNADILLNTSSARSLPFHLFVYGMFLISRFLINPAFEERSMKITNHISGGMTGILYMVGWSARWYRELQDRAVIIRVKESQHRLQSVREAQKLRRRTDQSAAEEVSGLLRNALQALKILLRGTVPAAPTTTIPKRGALLTGQEDAAKKASGEKKTGPMWEAHQLVEESMDLLAKGASKSTKKQTDEASARTEEDQFVEMYTTGGGVEASNADGTRMQKARNLQRKEKRPGTEIGRMEGRGDGRASQSRPQSRTSQVAAGEDESGTVIDGIRIPSLVLYNELSDRVGYDVNLRLLDYGDRSAGSGPNGGDRLLCEVGYILLLPYVGFLECSEECMEGFLDVLNRLYWSESPFHNGVHASMVSHMGFCILQRINIGVFCTELERISFIISCLGHDVGHTGKSNSFYIHTNSLLSILYNDISVMESCHSVLIQYLINFIPEINIFLYLSKIEFNIIRKLIISLIIDTDMSKHFDIISKFRVRRLSTEHGFEGGGGGRGSLAAGGATGGFNPLTNDGDRQIIMTLVLKAADYSYAVLDWKDCLEWSLRLAEEFYQQGQYEHKLGIMISPLCDRNEHRFFPKTQISFIQYVLTPLFEEICEIDQSGTIKADLLDRLDFNKERWETYKESKQTPEIPTRISDKKSPPPTFLNYCFQTLLRATSFKDLCQEPTIAAINKSA